MLAIVSAAVPVVSAVVHANASATMHANSMPSPTVRAPVDALVCTVKSIGPTVKLNCIGPTGSQWPGIFQFAGPLLGAFIGAAAALFGQWILTRHQQNLKEAEFKRIDEGVRRQVKALVSHVGNLVYFDRIYAGANLNRLGEFLERLESRVYTWEVSRALTDDQAEKLYSVVESVGITYRHTVEWKSAPDGSAHDPKMWSDTFNHACGALAEFWAAMGDERMAKAFRNVYHQGPGDEPLSPAVERFKEGTGDDIDFG
jgi:hypothetical protein